MGPDRLDIQARRYPGEWVAIAGGRVVAHGPDLGQVAQAACAQARDIAFERIPDPRASLWRPARPVAAPVARPARRRPFLAPRLPDVRPGAPGPPGVGPVGQ